MFAKEQKDITTKTNSYLIIESVFYTPIQTAQLFKSQEVKEISTNTDRMTFEIHGHKYRGRRGTSWMNNCC